MAHTWKFPPNSYMFVLTALMFESLLLGFELLELPDQMGSDFLESHIFLNSYSIKSFMSDLQSVLDFTLFSRKYQKPRMH